MKFPHCNECGGNHEPSGARSDCITHWKRRAVEAENKLLVAQVYEQPCGPCGHCGGTGHVDSGGFTPWGSSIELPCPVCMIPERVEVATVGASWKADSSLEKWFPLTAIELQKATNYKANIKTIIDFIKETRKPDDALNIEWVLWAAEMANSGHVINPEYLQATFVNFLSERPIPIFWSNYVTK